MTTRLFARHGFKKLVLCTGTAIAAGCATARVVGTLPKAKTPPGAQTEPLNPVTQGELPWWHGISPGVYYFRGRIVVLAVGESKNHHHVLEGYQSARANARVLVRKASEPIVFAGPIPEPELFDLFMTRKSHFFALYMIGVPQDTKIDFSAVPLETPSFLLRPARRRVGRHVFEADRHLFLECDIEGPIANPHWGLSRATAERNHFRKTHSRGHTGGRL